MGGPALAEPRYLDEGSPTLAQFADVTAILAANDPDGTKITPGGYKRYQPAPAADAPRETATFVGSYVTAKRVYQASGSRRRGSGPGGRSGGTFRRGSAGKHRAA